MESVAKKGRNYPHQFYLIAVCLLFWGIVASCSSAKDNPATDDETCIRIGIAWRADTTSTSFVSTVKAIREAGCEPVVLPMLKCPALEYDGDQLAARHLDEHGILLQEYADIIKRDTYKGVDIAAVVKGLNGLVFPGGEDICPTLFRIPQPWHGIESDPCDARRDVSDYMLMAWCLESDTLPVLCICRGMQLLSVVSGATMIQDLRTYFDEQGKTYNYLHREEPVEGKDRDFAKHDVTVTDPTSLLRRIVATDIVRDVPSWHHQAVLSVEGTPLKVTAITPTDGIDIIEAVERTDKRFIIGVQYHPEVAVLKHANHVDGASNYMSYDEALCYFIALKEQAKK